MCLIKSINSHPSLHIHENVLYSRSVETGGEGNLHVTLSFGSLRVVIVLQGGDELCRILSIKRVKYELVIQELGTKICILSVEIKTLI